MVLIQHGQTETTLESIAKMNRSEPAQIPDNQDEDRISQSVWWALETICDTPSLLILEACWLGDTSFTDICTSTGLQKSLVSNRLTFLQNKGLLKKKKDPENRCKNIYSLSRNGLSLLPIAILMLAWENQWGQQSAFSRIDSIHTTCGHSLKPDVRCQACGESVRVNDLVITNENMFFAGQKSFLKRRRQPGLNRKKIRIFHEIAEILGDRWTTLILRQAFMGTKKFDDFINSLGVATNILNDRLTGAIQKGLLVKSPYQQAPIRYYYLLTKKAAALLPIILMIGQWGIDLHYPNDRKPLLVNHKCGAQLRLSVACSHCENGITIETVKLVSQDSS